jgi:hypothetical protein
VLVEAKDFYQVSSGLRPPKNREGVRREPGHRSAVLTRSRTISITNSCNPFLNFRL